MGLFDFLKRKKLQPTPQPQPAPPPIIIFEEEYIDDITYIYEMRHIPGEQWQQYDVLLAASGYGWDMMKAWADYMAEADLQHIDEVTVGFTNNMIDSYLKHGEKCQNMPELEEEMRALSIAGFSKILNEPVKIVWFNQTRVLRFFTITNNELLMKKYIETVIRRNFGTADAMKLGKPIPEGQ